MTQLVNKTIWCLSCSVIFCICFAGLFGLIINAYKRFSYPLISAHLSPCNLIDKSIINLIACLIEYKKRNHVFGIRLKHIVSV